ncbi:auxin response factor 15-like isoform X1 [Musa acuminata AAA Group]|uniref:auxin response factor 15-like isoform X1 n=1 Tax=Musa acuminata AAA Group TaxID=214697 RepID=UPI0031DACC65
MGIDLNIIEEEEEEEEEERKVAVAACCGGRGSVCMELWHACAGPQIWLPRKGSLVVYFPQGHLEQLGAAGCGGGLVAPRDVPPHVLCRVLDVKLRAEEETDEVYAQLYLVAENKELEQQLQDDEAGEKRQVEESDDFSKAFTTHMFCKTLTASDTSSHGGFSIPRRAAEDCFPPLDYKQPRPSQELAAKDLHGTEWRFRHIYRGQPRRHLLTTGWSAFINKKKLVSGDSVLFLRGNDGELRLGIRRSDQLTRVIHSPFNKKNLGILTDLANAVSARMVFCINYNPRDGKSEFIIPYWKFTKSFNHSFSIGTRFKMIIDCEYAADRRCTGLITGTGELDPLRWPGSKWKCLLVRWDDEVDITSDNRVSPWDIEPTDSISLSYVPPTTGPKRTKKFHPWDHLDHPIPNGVAYPDLGESARFLEVLQGQEVMGSRTLYEGVDISNTDIRNNVGIPVGHFNFPDKGFGESVPLGKVLQGQELYPTVPTFQSTPMNALPESGARLLSRLLGIGSSWARSFQDSSFLGKSTPTSVPMFPQESAQFSHPGAVSTTDEHDKSSFGTEKQMPCVPCNMVDEFVRGHYSSADPKNDENALPRGIKSCRLFGFSLTETIPAANISAGSVTDMHYEESESPLGSRKASSAGRAVDHLKLGPRDDLMLQLGAV